MRMNLKSFFDLNEVEFTEEEALAPYDLSDKINEFVETSKRLEAIATRLEVLQPFIYDKDILEYALELVAKTETELNELGRKLIK